MSLVFRIGEPDEQRLEPAIQHSESRSHDVIFEAMQSRLAAQSNQILALDSKANFTLGSATLLTAAIATAGSLLQERNATFSTSLSVNLAINLLMIAAVAVYIAMIFSAYRGYRVQDYAAAPEPDELLNSYWEESADQTKADLSLAWKDEYERNRAIINGKARWVEWALRLLIVESVVLVVFAAAQSWA